MFSGTHVKVRVDDEKALLSFCLSGVRGAGGDKNQEELFVIANEAKEVVRDMTLQREVQIDLEFTDKKGNFFGTLLMKKGNARTNLATTLLERGLIHRDSMREHVIFADEYATAEEQAKENGVGLWKKGIALLAAGRNEEGKGEFDETEAHSVELTEIVDAAQFFVRFDKDAATLDKIEAALAAVDPTKAKDLERPIRQGTMCMGRFDEDGRWYRAKIARNLGKDRFTIRFVDYGNEEEVHSEDLKVLPASLLQYEALAKSCSLAFLYVPYKEKSLGEEAGFFLRKAAWDKKMSAYVYGQNRYGDLEVVLVEAGETDFSESVNAYMLDEGLAQIKKSARLPSEC